MRTINDQFDQAIEKIMDPFKSQREEAAMRANPLFAAGIRGLDRLKWDLKSGALAADQLKAQGL